MSLIKRFYLYQEERFPLKILAFTTSAVVLSSAAILSYEASLTRMLSALLACLCYLFHVRVIDESRDYQHDATYHAERPVQRGLISLNELFVLDAVGLVLFAMVCFLYGIPAVVYGIALLLFSYAAWKEFFMKKWLKKRFFLYNAINMFQMILLQLLIYGVLTLEFLITGVMWIHLLFVIWNTLLMEVVRKIKPARLETKGHDTYSSHLGFKNALGIFWALALFNFLTFHWMYYAIESTLGLYNVLALLLFLLLSIAVVFHGGQKSKKTEGLLLLTTVLNYVGLNLFIYLFNA